MSIRNYVGARYVPKFANPVEWQVNTSYEAMVIVTYNNSSYTSKIPVPPTVGNPAENPIYWALTGDYNAQVEQYRQETENVKINYSKCFNTTANMIADTSLTEGMTVKTLGYNKIADNGGAFYKIYNTKEQNSKHYENLSNGKYALLIPNVYITPEMFGAIGDGVTDDTNAFVESLNSNKLVYLNGIYAINSGVVIDNEVKIYGNGKVILKGDSKYGLMFNNGINADGISFSWENEFTDDIERFLIQVSGGYVNLRNCNITYDKEIDTKITTLFITTPVKDIPCVELDSCNIINKASSNVGGALWLWGSKYVISKCIVDKCLIESHSRDEVIAVWDSDNGVVIDVSVTNCNIIYSNTYLNRSDTILSNNTTNGTVKYEECNIDVSHNITTIFATQKENASIIVSNCTINGDNENILILAFSFYEAITFNNCLFKGFKNGLKIKTHMIENCIFNINNRVQFESAYKTTVKCCTFNVDYLQFNTTQEVILLNCDVNSISMEGNMVPEKSQVTLLGCKLNQVCFKGSSLQSLLINGCVGSLYLFIDNIEKCYIANNIFSELSLNKYDGTPVNDANVGSVYTAPRVIKNNWTNECKLIEFGTGLSS